MKKITALTAGLILAIATTGIMAAETAYVSDVLHVPVRSGAGTQFRIVHAGLPSGTRVQVVEVDGDWSLITTDTGVEGWTRNQYLVSQPTARIQLAQLEQRHARVQQQNDSLSTQVKELQQENAQLQAQLRQLQQKAGEATEELSEIKALSADAISLNRRHQELLEQHQILQTDVDMLRAKNDRLESDQTINQWIYGAALVLLGVILSIIIPALKPKKRSDWG